MGLGIEAGDVERGVESAGPETGVELGTGEGTSAGVETTVWSGLASVGVVSSVTEGVGVVSVGFVASVAAGVSSGVGVSIPKGEAAFSAVETTAGAGAEESGGTADWGWFQDLVK